MMIRPLVVVQQCQVARAGSGKNRPRRIQTTMAAQGCATPIHDIYRVSTYPPHRGDIFVSVQSDWFALIKKSD